MLDPWSARTAEIVKSGSIELAADITQPKLVKARQRCRLELLLNSCVCMWWVWGAPALELQQGL